MSFVSLLQECLLWCRGSLPWCMACLLPCMECHQGKRSLIDCWMIYFSIQVNFWFFIHMFTIYLLYFEVHTRYNFTVVIVTVNHNDLIVFCSMMPMGGMMPPMMPGMPGIPPGEFWLYISQETFKIYYTHRLTALSWKCMYPNKLWKKKKNSRYLHL